MRIFNESQILDIEFRKNVIDEIESNENVKRKDQAKKRYEVYKDNTKQYVLEMMKSESQDKEIVNEIINRMANISFCKKIISKKAMVYKDGVKRTITEIDPIEQEKVDDIYDYVNMNSQMKKTNRYAELFKNAIVGILPYSCPKTGKYYYMPSVLAPFLYDVIEDYQNPEMARCIITSYYTKGSSSNYAPENMSGYREYDVAGIGFRAGDGKDQMIADSPADDGINGKEYIWWSTLYHFTTDNKGNIIPGKQSEDLLNPIQELPFYNFSQEQDGHFWAVGGEDIIDGSILLNMLLSDLFYIAKYQGMGIGYMFGKGVPKNLKVGASSFVTLEMKDGDPTPQIGFVTSNPPIQSHLDMIETYVALILSTNKLDTSSVQTKLSATNAASGVHEIILRSENTEDLEDQQEIYKDGEPELFEIMKKWHNLYYFQNALVEDLQEIGPINEDTEIKIKFKQPSQYMTEKEKLEVIKIRRELELDSLIDSIMRDNPELTEEEAKEKLAKILEEKLLESNEKLKRFNSDPTPKPSMSETKSMQEMQDIEDSEDMQDMEDTQDEQGDIQNQPE